MLADVIDALQQVVVSKAQAPSQYVRLLLSHAQTMNFAFATFVEFGVRLRSKPQNAQTKNVEVALPQWATALTASAACVASALVLPIGLIFT